jgi:hypothetical protein
MAPEEDEANAARITGAASLQLVLGILAELKAKRIFSAQDVEAIFDSALGGAEQAPRSDLSNGVRRLLESLAAQIAALPSYEAGPESPSSDNPSGPT